MSGSAIISWLCLVLSVITIIVYTVAFACPYWTQKDFSVVVPGWHIGLPPPMDALQIPVSASSHMGLLKSCEDKIILIPGMPKAKKVSSCGSDSAKDWQYVAAGFGIAALVLGALSLAFSISIVVVFRKAVCKRIQAAAIVSYFITTVCILVPVILYSTKKIQVSPPLPIEFEYDLHWAMYVAIASIALYTILMSLSIALYYTWSLNPGLAVVKKDPSVSYEIGEDTVETSPGVTRF